MTKLEDQLRSELRAMAQQAQPERLRPLRAPAARTGWSARFPWAAGGRPSRKQRWLTAAAAVAAVAVIVAAVSIAGRLTQHQVAGPVAAMPRYYLNSADNGTVAVRRSATGRLLATVTPPAHFGFTWIAAAADDRRFVLAAVGGSGRHAVTAFYLLRLAADGRPAALTRLSYTVPAGSAGYYANSIALSPDASWLAVAVGPASGGGSGSSVSGSSRITEVLVATGAAVRSWTAPGQLALSELCWVRNGEISFNTYDQRPLPDHPPIQQLRLLNTARPGSDLLSASVVVRFWAPGSTYGEALVTPDGREIIAWTYLRRSDPSGGGGFDLEGSLGEYSVQTGQRLRMLYGAPVGRTLINSDGLLTADASGGHLLIEAENVYGKVFFGRIDHGRFTPLPHPNLSAGGLFPAAW
jgi:hypothetical protein